MSGTLPSPSLLTTALHCWHLRMCCAWTAGRAAWRSQKNACQSRAEGERAAVRGTCGDPVSKRNPCPPDTHKAFARPQRCLLPAEVWWCHDVAPADGTPISRSKAPTLHCAALAQKALRGLLRERKKKKEKKKFLMRHITAATRRCPPPQPLPLASYRDVGHETIAAADHVRHSHTVKVGAEHKVGVVVQLASAVAVAQLHHQGRQDARFPLLAGLREKVCHRGDGRSDKVLGPAVANVSWNLRGRS